MYRNLLMNGYHAEDSSQVKYLHSEKTEMNSFSNFCTTKKAFVRIFYAIVNAQAHKFRYKN